MSVLFVLNLFILLLLRRSCQAHVILNTKLVGGNWSPAITSLGMDIEQYTNKYFLLLVEFDPGCEAMIYDTDGTPLQGITGGFGGDRRVEYIISPEARKAGKHDIIIESSCNGMFGVPWDGDTISPPDASQST